MIATWSDLPRLDSNQDKESQHLLCYRYTTGYQNHFMSGKQLACHYLYVQAKSHAATRARRASAFGPRGLRFAARILDFGSPRLPDCSASHAAVLGQVDQERELLQLDGQI